MGNTVAKGPQKRKNTPSLKRPDRATAKTLGVEANLREIGKVMVNRSDVFGRKKRGRGLARLCQSYANLLSHKARKTPSHAKKIDCERRYIIISNTMPGKHVNRCFLPLFQVSC